MLQRPFDVRPFDCTSTSRGEPRQREMKEDMEHGNPSFEMGLRPCVQREMYVAILLCACYTNITTDRPVFYTYSHSFMYYT